MSLYTQVLSSFHGSKSLILSNFDTLSELFLPVNIYLLRPDEFLVDLITSQKEKEKLPELLVSYVRPLVDF